MPKMNVIRSEQINAPASQVFSVIHDMSQWAKWSPWLIMDPAAKVDVATDKKSYSWDGPRTGSGNMKVLSADENQSVDYELNFLKPWKSTAKVKFVLDEKDGTTQTSWHMDSSLPFFLFFMKKSMEAYVGMDFERGLRLLKDYVEDGQVHSQLNFVGYSLQAAKKYIGYHRKTTSAGVGPDMAADFDKIREQAPKYGSDMSKSMSIYHKFDMVKDKVEYTVAVEVEEVPTDLPADMISGSIPATKVYTLEHVGPYEHLGNAWSTLQSMIRAKEIKVKKGIHPYETYVNNPGDTDPNDLITQINFAVKD